MASEAPWRGLHSASILVNLIPRTWRTLIGFWPLLLALAVGGRGAGFRPGDGVFVLLFLGSGAASTLVHYLTLRYRVNEGRLEIRQGLLNRQVRSIDPARIQNVAMIRNPFHVMSGLVEVRLETAGELRTEGMLSALTVQDAEELIAALDAARGAQPREETAETPLIRLGVAELVAYGLSSGSAGLVTLIFAVGMEALSILEPERAQTAMAGVSGGRMAALILLAFAVSWSASAVLAVGRHYGYTLSLRAGQNGETKLGSREGLLTVRDVAVPLRKVQLVVADEPLLRRLMGFGTLRVETAGLGFSPEGGPPTSEITVPMVEQSELGSTAAAAIPGLERDPWTATLLPAHPRALRRAVLWAMLRGLLLAAPAVVAAWPWGTLALALVPVMMALAALDWWSQGWLVTERVVVARRGIRRRSTSVLARDKLQSVHLHQGPLLRLHGLGRLAVRVAGSQIVLPDLAYDDALSLMERLNLAKEEDG